MTIFPHLLLSCEFSFFSVFTFENYWKDLTWLEPRLNGQRNAARMEHVTIGCVSITGQFQLWAAADLWAQIEFPWAKAGSVQVTKQLFFIIIYYYFSVSWLHTAFPSFFLLLLPKYFARQLALSSFQLRGLTRLAEPFIILRGRARVWVRAIRGRRVCEGGICTVSGIRRKTFTASPSHLQDLHMSPFEASRHLCIFSVC